MATGRFKPGLPRRQAVVETKYTKPPRLGLIIWKTFWITFQPRRIFEWQELKKKNYFINNGSKVE